MCRKEREEASILNLLAVARDGKAVQGLLRRGRLTFRGAEGREVVMADQDLRRLVHPLRVEPVDDVPGTVALQRRAGCAD